MAFLCLSWLPWYVFSTIPLRIDDYRAFSRFSAEKGSKICNGLHAILPQEVNLKFSPPSSRWKEKKLTHRDEKFDSCLLSVSGGIGDSECSMRNCVPNRVV